MEPAAFIALIGAAAQASMHVTGIPASFTVAEAALESGWGSSELARVAKNLFGVKADPSWHGAVMTMNTREYSNGNWLMVPAKWRKYLDWQGCMKDHAAFFHQNERYRGCFVCTAGDAFARAVAHAGYATDPNYADKVIAVMQDHGLIALDAQPAQ